MKALHQTADSYQALRKQMRDQRRRLGPYAQKQAAKKLLSVVARLPVFQKASRVGIYLAQRGEIDPAPIKLLAEQAGKTCYLPVLHPLKTNRLHFISHREGEALQFNRFGIGEPMLKAHRITPIWSLQIIFVPLLAFDHSGNRLGMGGGFYDRSLAAVKARKNSGPALIGLAHSFQEVDYLKASPWDIPLHGIATERGFIAAE